MFIALTNVKGNILPYNNQRTFRPVKNGPGFSINLLLKKKAPTLTEQVQLTEYQDIKTKWDDLIKIISSDRSLKMLDGISKP